MKGGYPSLPGDLTPQQLGFFVILIVAFGLLITERLRTDITALLIVLALAVTRVLEPKDVLSGFSSEAAIVVAGIFVLSAGLYQTGLSDTLGTWVGRLAGGSYNRAIAVIMSSVALMSAFTHHLTTTALMLPVTMDLSRDCKLPASKLLMPLSFAASLGTTITIIGAPAFLIASAVLQQAGRPGLSIFSIAPIGLSLSLAGILFMLLAGRFLLPARTGATNAADRFRLDNYFTELTILPDSPLVGQTVEEVEANDRHPVHVVGVVGRAGNGHPRAFARTEPLREGDVLLVRTTPDQIVAFRQDRQFELHPVKRYEAEALRGTNGEAEEIEDLLVQAVVAPQSDFIGRTIGQIDFRRRYGVIVLSLWRRDGWLDRELSQIKLRASDVLVLQGGPEEMSRVENDRNFLMLVPFHGEARLRRKAPLAGAIMLATVVAAAFNWLSIELAALAGAVAMVLTGCLTPRQAYRAIDARIFVFIAGAIPLGAAMQKTGAADLLSGWLQNLIGGWPQMLILLTLFAVVGILTQFMSDAATTAIFAPVAVVLAQALGQPPEPYVVTVAMAAVASFLTPIGHHGNLLIYGPGGYRFADFVRAGAPLTVLVALVVTFLAPLLWRA